MVAHASAHHALFPLLEAVICFLTASVVQAVSKVLLKALLYVCSATIKLVFLGTEPAAVVRGGGRSAFALLMLRVAIQVAGVIVAVVAVAVWWA